MNVSVYEVYLCNGKRVRFTGDAGKWQLWPPKRIKLFNFKNVESGINFTLTQKEVDDKITKA